LIAMHHVTAGGGGQLIDVALYEAVLAAMESMVPEYAMFGHVRERTGATLPGIAPSNTYPSTDGGHVIIAGNGDAIFKRLMRAIGRADLADDPALARNDQRVEHAARLDDAIGAWTAARPLAEILRELEAADVPAGRIYTAADIHRDPHVNARGMIEHHVLADGTPIDVPGVVPKLSETPGETRWLGPELGEHTTEVLTSLGITAERIGELRAAGVVA
jgi:formyl-CoA transferase